MAVNFVCRYDEGEETCDLLRKTENVIPKIIGLLHSIRALSGGMGDWSCGTNAVLPSLVILSFSKSFSSHSK